MTNGKWLAIVLLIGLLLAPPALAGDKTLVVGTRIPQLYFTTTGSGQTDLGSGHDPWETGSYDLALLKAGIENFNIMEYSSVLPPESKEISQQEAKKYYHHGAVLETIMANVNGRQGDQLCAGGGPDSGQAQGRWKTHRRIRCRIRGARLGRPGQGDTPSVAFGHLQPALQPDRI